MAPEIATEIAKEIGTSVVAGVIQQVKNVVQLEEKLNRLNTDFRPVKRLLLQIEQQFQDQQTRLPEAIEECLTSMTDHLKEGQLLINRANQQRRRFFGCRLMCNPNLFTRITDWETRFRQLFQELVGVFSVSANATQIVSASAPQTDVLLQPVPESGFVGPAIQSAQMRLQTQLGEAHRQARMVGVCGMGGVGKTSLLRLLYNKYKEVSSIFDVVIWFTVSQQNQVSQQYQIEKLQACIAETLHLKLEGSSDKDIRKMKLFEALGQKKFLLILDNMWHTIDLNEVGVKFGDHNRSKVLMSSRNSDVIRTMGARDDYSLKIETLPTEDGWLLFRREAFTNGAVPKESIQAIARKIALECRGLPLALNVVAAAMRFKKTEDEWSRAWNLMRKVDRSFRTRHSTIDAELYQRLRWSYDDLADLADLADTNLKICFLYCAVFPDNAEIDVETLVEMWSAEKLVTGMDAGHEYIEALVGRCLFEYVVGSYGKRVKVHDILHDLAIYIGKSEEKWLFASGQQRQNFPSEDEIRDCKRISVGHNDIQDLPTDLVCSKLLSLVLANNAKIRKVPELFLSTAMTLKVLDLSCTSITSLPTSLGQLEQLEFLNLSGCFLLKNLPESIGNLSRLRFLNIENCPSLESLPESIRELRNLKHLKLGGCNSLMGIPHGISHLTSLNKLFLPIRNNSCAISVEDFANLSDLMELTAMVKSAIKKSTMTTWTNLRRLEVMCLYDADRDDVVEYIFPLNMENVKKLEDFTLYSYEGVSLPNCNSQFQNLRTLELFGCSQLRELPACEIRNGIVRGGFPMLKSLVLEKLEKLESMVGSSVVSSEETMPELEEIYIKNCRSLKRLGTKKLPSLKKLQIFQCEEFEALEIESGDLPMLEELSLNDLDKFESIVGPSGVINDGVMPKLQKLYLHTCGLLKRLGLEKLPNLRRISIDSCRELREIEVGSGGFPMLESLNLLECPNLESIVGPHDVWNEKTMPKLQVLQILHCPLVRRLGLEKLPNLRTIIIYSCRELREIEVGSGGFPMLESLHLMKCPNLESIVGPHDVWNEKTMPELKVLQITGCPLVRRLPRGIEKLSKLHKIFGEVEWWQKLIWEDDNVKNNLSNRFIH